jgi:hypothetical protein
MYGVLAVHRDEAMGIETRNRNPIVCHARPPGSGWRMTARHA